jgi:hypothetical protein
MGAPLHRQRRITTKAQEHEGEEKREKERFGFGAHPISIVEGAGRGKRKGGHARKFLARPSPDGIVGHSGITSLTDPKNRIAKGPFRQRGRCKEQIK